MKPAICLVLFVFLATLAPRYADACDYSCATLERMGGTVLIGIPTTLVTTILAPAIVSGLSEPGENETLPSYKTGVWYSFLGSTAGLTLALVFHSVVWPDSEYGGAGTGMGTRTFVAYWVAPPLLLGTAGALYANKYKRKEKLGSAPGLTSYFAGPTEDGFMVGLGGRF